MPASLIYDFDNSANVITTAAVAAAAHNGLEDRRAFELALELSLLGLGSDSSSTDHTNAQPTSQPNGGAMFTNSNQLMNPFDGDARLATKRSQNTTECVPVPSSEHVAEIVGRQGCKIKALRAKTNTYIKTPVRGEEPVFVVTGRKEDVSAAKREILSAAEHFSQIRAQRKNNPGSVGPAPNAHLPGHVTVQVRVPYRVVGLVVGPKGATIKRIQQQTNTYIITPSRDKDPVFEVTGLPEDVDTARKEIEAHIAIRTGGIIDSTAGSIGTPEESTSDFSNSPLLSSLDNPFSNYGNSLYKSSDPFSSFTFSSSNSAGNQNPTPNSLLSNSSLDAFTSNNFHGSNTANGSSSKFTADIYSAFNGLSNSGKNTSNGSYDTDEGIGDSPTFDILGGGGASLVGSIWPEFNGTANILGSNSIEAKMGFDYHRRSSSLESNITSSNSSCVSSSAPASSSMI